jgi:pimeloyl-ACP methyl ester carboxylesterase
MLPEASLVVPEPEKEETTMPYANNQGVRIHYEVEGEGPPLVLQHGGIDCIESWYELGYVHALKTDYQLILIDARGHGASDKPHDPNAYGLQWMVADVMAVFDALHIPKAHFWGYSMGGWIGFGLAKYVPERFSSLIIGGTHPYGSSLELRRQQVRSGIEQGMEVFVASLVATYKALWPGYKARLLATDLEAHLAHSQDRPSLEEVLPTMTMPCLLYAGEADANYPGVKECLKHIPNVTFFSLPALNHPETFVQSHLVLPHITTFLETVPL